MNKVKFLGTIGAALAVAAVVSACGDGKTRSTGWEFSRNMYDAIGYDADQPNPNFADGLTAQTPPAGSVPIGFDRFEYDKSVDGWRAAGEELTNPLDVSEANLQQGQALYNAYCAVCHGVEGKGDGPITMDRQLVTQAGSRQLENFPPPPSFASSDGANSTRSAGPMANLNDGNIYHTIYWGYNVMGSHASQLDPEERWKVVMYVRELQKK